MHRLLPSLHVTMTLMVFVIDKSLGGPGVMDELPPADAPTLSWPCGSPSSSRTRQSRVNLPLDMKHIGKSTDVEEGDDGVDAACS